MTGVVVHTGGLALDTGLVEALREEGAERLPGATITTRPDGIFAGAIGAALWGAYRHQRLAARQARGQDAVAQSRGGTLMDPTKDTNSTESPARSAPMRCSSARGKA